MNDKVLLHSCHLLSLRKARIAQDRIAQDLAVFFLSADSRVQDTLKILGIRSCAIRASRHCLSMYYLNDNYRCRNSEIFVKFGWVWSRTLPLTPSLTVHSYNLIKTVYRWCDGDVTVDWMRRIGMEQCALGVQVPNCNHSAKERYYQSRIKCPLFFEKLRWSDDNKHPTRLHTILKNTKTEFFAF